MAGTFTQLTVHVVFSTSQRLPLIRRALREPLYAYIGGIVRGEQGALLEIGGMPDHLHLLVRAPARMAIADLVRRVKSNSTRWANRQAGAHQKFAWQSGYAAFTVSESAVAAVREYIRNQESHHRKRSFKEELATLLARHGVECDTRFLVD